MSKETDVLKRVRYEGVEVDYEDYRFWCPGCEEVHHIRAKGPKPCWEFNGSMTKPTFSPSHLTGCCEIDDAGKIIPGSQFTVSRCHSYIENGKIRFLDDCHHQYKGQTIDLPTREYWRYGN